MKNNKAEGGGGLKTKRALFTFFGLKREGGLLETGGSFERKGLSRGFTVLSVDE